MRKLLILSVLATARRQRHRLCQQHGLWRFVASWLLPVWLGTAANNRPTAAECCDPCGGSAPAMMTSAPCCQ